MAFPTLVRLKLLAIAVIALALMGAGYYFFPESTFTLDNSSRIPQWFTLPQGLARADVSVTMSFYSYPGKSKAVFVIQDNRAHKRNTVLGTVCEFSEESSQIYPLYEAITVGGVTEIMEHKKQEPLFNVSDDPIVWKQYKSHGCRTR